MTVEELVEHRHLFYLDSNVNGTGGGAYWFVDAGIMGTRNSKNYGINRYTEFSGNDKPHNNIPPAYACYCWIRIA